MERERQRLTHVGHHGELDQRRQVEFVPEPSLIYRVVLLEHLGDGRLVGLGES